MKFFPIKTAILCLVLTPGLYILSLTACETYLKQKYTHQIENVLIGDTEPLLDGSVHLEEQIAKNIHAFQKSDHLLNLLKLKIDILITTQNGRIIYPLFLDINNLSKEITPDFNSQDLAKKNFSLMNAGLFVKIEINIQHGSTLSLLFLFLFSSFSFLVFFYFYRSGSIKAAKEGEEKTKLISELKTREENQQKRLEQLKHERKDLFKDIESLNKKYQDNKEKAKENEEDLFEEIISLESKLNSFIELKKNKEIEIDTLKSQIEKYERRKGSKTKRIDFDFVSKRFSALYRNVVMNRKALSGFLNLNDDQQIKAEEIIMLLDRSPDNVTIKRKVFSGKKHKTASFEVLFSYNGRLYFNRDDNNNTQILVIGTKNTQQKDMEYLHSL